MKKYVHYSKDIAIEICSLISEGYTLTKIAKMDGMPSIRSIFSWLSDERYPEFTEMYKLAKQDQADALADEVIDIADDSSNDYIEVDGKQVYNAEHVNRSRLKIDARKWYAGKVRPKKYSDRLQTEVTGADGGPIETTSDNDPQDIARQVAFLLSKGIKPE